MATTRDNPGILPAVPSADVNWLLSTEVQSGAALVAIIGGLLVARLTGLAGERSYLRRALSDTETELRLARQNRLDAETELGELTAGAFLTWAHQDLLDRSGVVDDDGFAEMMAESGWAVKAAELDRIVRPFVSQVRLAFEKARGRVAAGQPINDYEDVRSAIAEGVPGIDSGLIDDVVRRLARNGELGRQAVQQQQIALIARSSADGAVAATDRATRDRRLDDAQSRIDQHRGTVRALEARRDSLRAARAQAARPQGLGRILAALSYLAGVCVVGPLALMAWGRISLPAWARVVVVVLFISGLIVFLLVMVGFLRDKPTRRDAA
jgi:hypothetical protein